MTISEFVRSGGKGPKEPVEVFTTTTYQQRPTDELTLGKKLVLGLVLFVLPSVSIFTLVFFGTVFIELVYWRGNGSRAVEAPDDNWRAGFGTFFDEYYVRQGGVRDPAHPAKAHDWNGELPWFPYDARSCATVRDIDRIDCFPKGIVSNESCVERGCCFQIDARSEIPACYYPSNYSLYRLHSVSKEDPDNWTFLYNQTFKSAYPTTFNTSQMHFAIKNSKAVVISVFMDSFEPNPFRQAPVLDSSGPNPLRVDTSNSSFITISRLTTNRTLLSIPTPSLVYSDQLVQVTIKLNTSLIYGLGERRGPLLADLTWKVVTLMAHDSAPANQINGYGSHPMFLASEPDGNSFGVFFDNMYPMDVVLTPSPSVTYRALGGPVVIYVMPGPTPEDVVRQYGEIVGTTFLPPYWSLGFHLSRFGYKNVSHMNATWSRNEAAGIPMETQWSDIDYMKNRNDFTLDEVNFGSLGNYVRSLHQRGKYFIPILDPGVSASEPRGQYPPYDKGLEQGIFIMDPDNKAPLVGKVWNPKSTVFPDFSNPRTANYWLDLFRDLYSKVEFDGIWIDMNEPSNFVDGSQSGCPNNSLENPPYVPGVDGGHLSYKTICMSAMEYAGRHYKLHNSHGFLETVCSAYALYYTTHEKRPFVISRSTTFGSGTYGGHWTGDVFSSWEDLRQSVADMMTFSMFQIPMVGADICGFNGNTTTELCARWHQLGAFYPFSRNHNTDDAHDQDAAALGATVVQSAKKALTERYYLLPYLYTLFWDSHQTGSPVIKPTFMLFPKDKNTHTLENQFFWGSGLLIAPAVEAGQTVVSVYLGKGLWYDWYTKEQIQSSGSFYNMSAPADTLPLLARGGTIFPAQTPSLKGLLASRSGNFTLEVALDDSGSASGRLVWDDGLTLDALGPKQVYNDLEFSSLNNTLRSKVNHWNYFPPAKSSNRLDEIRLYTVNRKPSAVKLTVGPSTKPLLFTYSQNKVLLLSNLNINLQSEFTITWT